MEDQELERRLKTIENCSKENNRALRGYDGEIGLVARVELIYKLLDNDLKHLTAKTVTWPWLLEKLLLPVSMALIIGWLLFRLNF